jgi:REP element-mobilizing transposase RayT
MQIDSKITQPVNEASLDWLKDVNRAAQRLTSLSLESSAQAALILRQGELWAYAGHLSQPAVQELALSVITFWSSSFPSKTFRSPRSPDMVRVLHLSATDGDYMLYVTAMGREMVLALAFGAETPLSTIRAQANYLARSLSAPVENRLQITSTHSPQLPAFRLPERPNQHVSPPGEITPVEEDFDLDDLEGELPVVNLPPLLDNIPPPDPKVPYSRPVQKPIFDSAQGLRSHPGEVDASQATSPFMIDRLKNLDEGTAMIGEEKLRPISPALHGLYYVCLMIPRLPQHHLAGDLASAISEMINQLCLAYGWRLEHIAVRPEYIQWIANVPPVTSPSYLMRIIRQQTSERIFEAFPTLRNDNPSGDFWAPGYLIMSGSQLPPAHIIKEFIQQTRLHQGVNPNFHSKA